MKLYEIDDLAEMLENGIRDNCDRELLGNSVFYYCCGKDITPLVAFGAEYRLYVYADIVNYGEGDFDNLVPKMYDKMKEVGFEMLDKRELKIGQRAVLTKWNSKQNQPFYLVYIMDDAKKTFCKIYYDKGKGEIQPKCICNFRREMLNGDGVLAHIEKRAEYVLGHCYSDKYVCIAEYDYYGDYQKGGKVKLYKRAFWYVY